MPFLARFATIKEKDKTAAVEKLIAHSTPDFDFFYLIILSVVMATTGLLIGSEAVIIGSMLIAPILFPIISIALGMAMSDRALITRSAYTTLKAGALGIFIAMVTTIFFVSGSDAAITDAILSRIEPSLPYALVAFVAGLAVSYSLVRPELSATFPGIAVSVALLPPLAVVGIGLAMFNLQIVTGSLLLFFLNVLGIVFACIISFALMDVHGKRAVVKQTIQKENKRVEEENKEVEKVTEKVKEEVSGATTPQSESH